MKLFDKRNNPVLAEDAECSSLKENFPGAGSIQQLCVERNNTTLSPAMLNLCFTSLFFFCHHMGWFPLVKEFGTGDIQLLKIFQFPLWWPQQLHTQMHSYVHVWWKNKCENVVVLKKNVVEVERWFFFYLMHVRSLWVPLQMSQHSEAWYK